MKEVEIEGVSHLNLRPMGVESIRPAIRCCLDTRQAFLIHGVPGIGKTALVREAAEENQYQLSTVNLSHMDYTSAHGARFPDIEAGITRQLHPDFMPKADDPPTLIFFDEFGAVELEASRRPVAQLVLEGRIGLYRLDPKHRVAMATNLGSEDGVMNLPLDPMLANRLVHFYFSPSSKDWASYFAIPKGIHPTIIAYLQTHPEDLNHFESPEKRGQVAMATPRAWERASDQMTARGQNLDSDMREEWFQDVLGGILSRPVQIEFCEFFRSSTGFVDPEAILESPPGKRKAGMPKELAPAWTFAAMLATAFHQRTRRAKTRQELLKETERAGHTCLLLAKIPTRGLPAMEIAVWAGNRVLDNLFARNREEAARIVEILAEGKTPIHRDFEKLIEIRKNFQ